MRIRTRIAPSPTGFVHIGTVYNALFAHALAKHFQGDFILRIEDTDQKRFIEGAQEELYKILDVFGLTPDEGPVQGGEFTPYIQSERIASGIYLEAAKKLVENGNAYYCFMTSEELKEIKERNDAQKIRKAFRSPFRDTPLTEAMQRIEKGEKYVIRLKVPENETITVVDAILGEISWNSEEIDDQVLLKSDGFPTYHLGVVVDDVAMKITHVTRGYEWLPSTPKHVLIYRYLGHELPIFAHSGLVLDPEGGKLSKRKGNVSAKQFLIEGYLVSAMINFMILMSWSPPIKRVHGEKEREIFSHEEFIKMYELSNRNKNNAVFDRNKLIWFNQQYIMAMTPDELLNSFKKWMDEYASEFEFETINFDEMKSLIASKGDEFLKGSLLLEQSRAKLFSEMLEKIASFYKFTPNTDYTSVKQLKKLSLESYKDIVSKFISRIENMGDAVNWTHELWEESIREIAEECEVKAGEAFMALRFATTASSVSPPLFESMQLLGSEEVKKRLTESIK